MILMNGDRGDGVKINLISRRKLDEMSSADKLRFILDEVKADTVLVLERGLTAIEEVSLIKATMAEIDHDTFIGIEMQSYSPEDVKRGSWLRKLLGRPKVPKMSVIGPAHLLKTIRKDSKMIQAMILTGRRIVAGVREPVTMGAEGAPPIPVPEMKHELEEEKVEAEVQAVGTEMEAEPEKVTADVKVEPEAIEAKAVSITTAPPPEAEEPTVEEIPEPEGAPELTPIPGWPPEFDIDSEGRLIPITPEHEHKPHPEAKAKDKEKEAKD